jgi:hypothetical protein
MSGPFRLYTDAPIVRLGGQPREPKDGPPPRPPGSRRPHTDAKVAAVRRLIEETPLTFGEISKKTGVGRASICRWTRDHGWRRHPFAPRATDTVPRARASAKLKRRTLAARLDALAERHIRELEESACVDPEKLAAALELLKIAKLAARPRRRKRTPGAKPELDFSAVTGERLRPVSQLCAADVDLQCAPRAAVEDFVAYREPPAEPPPRRPRGWARRGRRFSSDEHHAWMLEKE